jgi:hypothetical protein
VPSEDQTDDWKGKRSQQWGHTKDY